MKKLFEAPRIDVNRLDAADAIMASADLVKLNTGLGALEDSAPAADSSIWTGAGEGWM